MAWASRQRATDLTTALRSAVGGSVSGDHVSPMSSVHRVAVVSCQPSLASDAIKAVMGPATTPQE
jgi:hypothetical protein